MVAATEKEENLIAESINTFEGTKIMLWMAIDIYEVEGMFTLLN